MTARLHALSHAHEQHILERLKGMAPNDHWIVSCFVGLSAEGRTRSQYLGELKSRFHDSRQGFGTGRFSTADGEALERDFQRILEVLKDRAKVPDVPGLAIFACDAARLLEVIPLPRPVRTRVTIDHVPHLAELRLAEAEFGRVIAIVTDRVRARFFEVTAWETVELAGIAEQPHIGKFHSDRHDSPGWGEKDYHHRIERERERHYDLIVRRLRDLDRAARLDGIVIAGHVRDIAGLKRFLDDTLAERLVGTTRLDPRMTSPAKVKAAVFRLYAEHQRAGEARRVNDLREQLGAGWAVDGVQATTRALARGQVRTLLVRADAESAEADQALEDALDQGVDLVAIHDPEAAAQIHELAGFLRFR